MSKKRGPIVGSSHKNAHSFSFGKTLFTVRTKKGLTQAELADKMGMSVRTISYYERQAKNPTFKFIEDVANALEVPKKVFLNEEGKSFQLQEMPKVIKSLKAKLPKLSYLPRKEQESLAMVIDGMLAKHKVA